MLFYIFLFFSHIFSVISSKLSPIFIYCSSFVLLLIDNFIYILSVNEFHKLDFFITHFVCYSQLHTVIVRYWLSLDDFSRVFIDWMIFKIYLFIRRIYYESFTVIIDVADDKREIKFVNSHYTNCQNDTHTERYTYIIIIIILYRYNKRNIS